MIAYLQIIAFMEGTATRTKGTAKDAEVVATGAEARELARQLGAVMYATAATAGEFFRTLEATELTLTQCKVLTALVPGPEGEPQAAKHVAARTGASLPTLSRAIDALVRRDLVLREADADDRRVRNLVLTEQGERLARQLLSTRVDGLATFIADLTPAQRRKLSTALDSLLEREDIAVAYRELKEDAK
jgi:DNA-binding MarR family transcriptional regulator